jgi:hypothetical protein
MLSLAGQFGSTSGILVDANAPTVASVTVPTSGSYKAGATLDFTVNFNEAVTVTGTDSVLGLTIGGTARSAAYQTKSANSITYRYTVQAGDNDSDGIAVGAITLNTSTVKDAETNNATMTLNSVGATTGVLVDTTGPNITDVSVPFSGTYVAGNTLDFTVNFDEAVTVTGTDSVLGITVGSTARSAVYSSKTTYSITYRYTVQAGDSDSNGIIVGSITLNTTTVEDTATNSAVMTLNSVGSTSAVLIDGVAPYLTGPITLPSNATYHTGQNLDFTVTYSEAVNVITSGGTPYITLTLNTGGTVPAYYVSGSGTTTLIFRYLIALGNQDMDGITHGTAIVLNGASIKDQAGNDAMLSLAGQFGSTSGILVDAMAPTVASVTVPSSGSYKAGDTLDFTVNFSEAVTVTGTDSVLGITIGGTVRSAAYQTKSANSITYRYTVQSGDNDSDGIAVGSITLNTSTVKDAETNNATMTLNSVGATTGVLIDTTGPSVTDVSVPFSGTYKIGDNLDFTVNFDEAVTVTGTDSVLGITVGSTARSAVYQSKTANSITYRYTVQAGDNDSDGITVGSITLNATTVEDTATNSAVMTLNSIASTSGILIDTVAPAVTSVTVPSAGTYKAGDTLDFTVNFDEAVTVTGTDTVLGITVGSTATNATYQSKTASSITYRYTVQAGDNDSNGIEVGSITLNTTTVKDAATNNAVMTLNSIGSTAGILIDAKAPTVTSVTVPASGTYKAGDTLDFIVNFSEAVTVTGTDSVLGITIGSTARSAAYQSKSANSITYRYTVQAGENDSDGIAVGSITLNTTTVKDAMDNNATMTFNSVGATTALLIDTTGPTVVSVAVPSSGTYKTGNSLDFTVNFSEAVTITGTDSVLGITVGSTARNAAYQSKTANSITYRYTVQAGDADSDGITVGTITWNTTTVQDAATNEAILTLNSIGTTTGVLIDTTVQPTGGSNNTGNSSKTEGKLEKEQEQDPGAPAASINNSIDTLKEGVLTPAEQAEVAAGKDAKVTLKIEDISKTVSDEAKKLVEEKLSTIKQNTEQQNTEQPNNETAILYVDISLFKQVGNEEATRVTQTSNKISISIEIPQELRNSDGDNVRTYKVVRIHDNQVEILDGIYDPVTHLFTFETDRFSVYALTYQDTKNVTDSTKDEIVVYKDFSHLRLSAKAAATTQKLKFTKVSGADGYLIYGALCGKDMTELADVTATVTSYTVKDLKQATYYKYQVKAYKLVNGEKVIIAVSKVIHTITTGKIYENPVKVTSDVSQVTLEIGKTQLVNCEVVLPEGKKLLKHTKVIRYESTNKAIATVNSKGEITATAKGVCYVYAYAQNGVYKKIKVTVE